MIVWRRWFWAAAIYNLVWGAWAGLHPESMLSLIGLPAFHDMPLFRCIGMMVMVYALGYAMIAIDPERYAAFVWIGLLGKLLGPVGFLFGAVRGDIPWQFGWINVFNDLVWLPAFAIFAWRHAKPDQILPKKSS